MHVALQKKLDIRKTTFQKRIFSILQKPLLYEFHCFQHHLTIPISTPSSDLRQELDVTKKKKDEPETPPTPTVVKVKPEVKVEPSTSNQQPLNQQNSILKENSGQSHAGDSSMATPARPASLKCESFIY